ncbi:MAG: efflux RND transporter periplasmic adaptor subunit [Patescibacteria group bacterium]|nr:efflux RND transporter periplasmic adaptor subunit [Patescibacteria group bacterium]
MKKKTYWAIVLSIITIAIYRLIVWFFFNSSEEQAQPEPQVEVKVAKPASVSDSVYFESQGKVTFKKSFAVSPLSEGRIKKLYVMPGEFVKSGQLVALLVNSEQDRELSTLEGKLRINKNSVESLEKKLKSSEEMLNLGIIAENDLISLKNDINARKSEGEDIQITLDRLKSRNDNYKVYSNTDGYVSDLMPENSFVTYGQSIANIFSLRDEIVEALIPFDQVNQPEKNQEVLIVCNNLSMDGTVTDIYPFANSNLIKVLIAPEKVVPLNLEVKVRFKIQNINGIVIPKSAVVMDEGKPVIYLVKNNKAAKKFIKVQKDYLDKVIIVNDLNPDDDIVIENAYLLSDQTGVIIK